MAAIDLYSGIGGWTLGLRMAGIPEFSSYEWWKDANNTHNRNFGSTHRETDIRKLDLDSLPNPNDVDFVVGSPPCTQFSYANRGGNGDIADGLVDIYKFLEIVEYLDPRYWAMENVPRVAKILEKETLEGGSLERFSHLFGEIKVYDSSDFGVPQKRKRMIAGRLPFHLLESYKSITPRLNMGDILDAFIDQTVVDPIYGIEINRDNLIDNETESPLSTEEERLNRNAKTFHPVYNKMSFPDQWDKPSRTITSVCTRVSRESIVINDHQNNYRRLTVRERGSLQSFPINYQFHSNSYGGKLKMIGNAVPPLLTFYIAQAMQERDLDTLQMPNEVQDRIELSNETPVIHPTDRGGSKFSWSRSFWLAIPELRFGSGVRFELKNYNDKVNKSTSWKVNFFYGNSKNIKAKELDSSLYMRISEVLEKLSIPQLNIVTNELIEYCRNIDIQGLQENWTNKDRDRVGPIAVVDDLGRFARRLKNIVDDSDLLSTTREIVKHELVNQDGHIENKKLIEFSNKVFIGLIIGSSFNHVINKNFVEAELVVS